MPYPAGQGMMTYKSTLYHFEVTYPSSLGQVSDRDEGKGAHSIVFDDGKDKTFQVFVTPYSGTTIGRDRFLADEPSGVMTGQQDVVIDGVRGTKFYSTANSIGDTVEVWFIHGGYLYEALSYKELEPWLAQIMSTWKFI